jgi:hypothetical protein
MRPAVDRWSLRAALASLALILASVGPNAGIAFGKPAALCPISGKVLARSAHAIVVAREGGRSRSADPDYSGVTACWRPTRRVLRLDGGPSGTTVNRVWLSGRFLAVVQSEVLASGAAAQTLSVVNLARPRGLRTFEDGQCDSCGFFPRVILLASGAIAYTAGLGIEGVPWQVFACSQTCVNDRSQRPLLLDPGPEVERKSLRRSDGMLTWRSGGEVRTAPLP